MSSTLPDHRLSELKEVFSAFDLDGDGTIDASELGQVLRDLGQPATENEIRDLLAVVDTDNNGVIDFEEFCVMMTSKFATSSGVSSSALPKGEEIRSVFGALDKNKDGKISMDDLKEVIGGLDWKNERPPSESDLRLMLNLALGGVPDDDPKDAALIMVDFAAFQSLVLKFDSLAK